MLNDSRQLTTDITDSVRVDEPVAVMEAVGNILQARYPGHNFRILQRLFQDTGRLYNGSFPGFCGCETDYHNLQHVLDVTLAFTRLLDGYEQRHQHEAKLGANLALAGVIVALFHDSGYIRRSADRTHHHGAEYTRVHVSRSAQFMSEYLPSIGLAHFAPLAEKLVHFTGYELDPELIDVADDKQRVIGSLIGTADVIAQMSDQAYLLKCYDHLFEEFRIAGVTEVEDEAGRRTVLYSDANELLRKTPAFFQMTMEKRLDGCFAGHYHYAAEHFQGSNPYLSGMMANQEKLRTVLNRKAPDLRAELVLVSG